VPGLNKELTLKYLKKSQTQAIRNIDEMKGEPVDKSADPMIVMQQMMIKQARMQDELF
jgi:hypothetical protein